MAGVPVFVAEPSLHPAKESGQALLFFHGGGLVIMGGECASHFGTMQAVGTRCRVSRPTTAIPPDHPYPAALG